MRYDTRYRSRSSLFNWSFPSGVKWLIISNVAVYLVYFFGSYVRGEPIFGSLELMPAAVIRGAVWQLVTYLFLHSLSSFWHILFNMLMLWMFGAPIEETWGTRRFLQYYFVCGIGAGICVVLVNLAFGNPHQRVIGASGAIYGLLLAFGMLFPNQTGPDMSFLFPIKAKYMVMIFGAIAFMARLFSDRQHGQQSGASGWHGLRFRLHQDAVRIADRRQFRLRFSAAMERIQTAARPQEVQSIPEEARIRQRSLGSLKRLH